MISSNIETKAQEVLDQAGIKSSPVEVEQIAKHFGIEIKKGPSNDFSGLLLHKADKAYIAVNSNEAKVRQRFTIAHEIGHFILHKNSSVFVEYRDNQKGIIRTPKELEANAFAAALLMPSASLEKDMAVIVKKGMFEESDLKTLCEKYAVSEDAMKIRLINLSYILDA